jgi:hypothetical protein
VRIGRWGRARFPRGRATWLAPFVAPDVARALVAQPFEDRMAMRFHREHAARLGHAIEARPTQRRGIPGPLRRLASAARRRAAPAEPGPLAPYLAERPAVRAWLAEVAPGLDLAGAAATETALLAGGLVLYREALDILTGI